MTTQSTPHTRTIALHGDLRASDLPLLIQEMDGDARPPASLAIDLANVTLIDAGASRFLLDLSRRGVTLLRPSSYFEALLHAMARDSATPPL